MNPEATLRLGPALMDSVERRAVFVAGLVGTKSVYSNFSRGRQFVVGCLPGSAAHPCTPTQASPGLSNFRSSGSGSFRTELGEAARRSIPIRRRADCPEERISFALIFYEAGGFPQRPLVSLGAESNGRWVASSCVRIWRNRKTELRRQAHP